MNRYRMFLLLGLALTSMVGVSCTSGGLPLFTENSADLPTETGGDVPTVPTDTAGAMPPDTAGAVPTGDSGEPSLLACEPQQYAADMRVIGPDGGQLLVGNHKLTVMAGALSEEVAIVMEQIEGTVNSVRLSPEGLHFAIPAILSLSYKNCPTIWHPKRIVYTDESLNILEWMLSLDLNKASQVKGLIYHFSRYAVAY